MLFRSLAVLACAATAVAGTPGTALADTRTVPLGVHETFGGTVNGATTHATIHMACFGPERPGRVGHPMSGQNVGIFVPEALRQPTFGQTGTRARAVVAWISVGGRLIGPVARFRRLELTRPVLSATRPLPTYLTLPCSGPATVVFTPVPGTRGAASATVDASLAAQP